MRIRKKLGEHEPVLYLGQRLNTVRLNAMLSGDPNATSSLEDRSEVAVVKSYDSGGFGRCSCNYSTPLPTEQASKADGKAKD
jgi:hypothetical protein